MPQRSNDPRPGTRPMPGHSLASPWHNEEEHVSLCELLDRVLNKGVVVRGDIVISVANVDLLYLGVQLVLSSTETAREAGILLPHDMTRTAEEVKQAQQLAKKERSS